ncbi:MAG: leucyl aminopeptidase [Chromatiales bacterium]|nr:MAG: leucyl aminopeptidase [Chromatiales bacterium]
MQFQVSTATADKQRTDCLILPVYSNGATLPAPTRAADRALGGQIAELVAAGDMRGNVGDTLLVRAPSGLPFKRVLLTGCGDKKDYDRKRYQRALRAAYAAWRKTKIAGAACYLTTESPKGADVYHRARLAVETWHDSAYRFTTMKSKQDDKQPAPRKLTLGATAKQAAQARKGASHGDAIGQGMSLAKDLGNLPGNVCTPSYLVKQARDIAKGDKQLTVEVLQEAEMRKLGMGAMLSVTAGTSEPARFIVLHYRGAAKSKAPAVLVGKGITFDAGGISLKPPPQMDEMKYDMCGAATVLGVFHALRELGPKMNVVGIIPSCENLPSGTATKPGDIVTSMSGQTIEILNTDAEGRLILCDALTYAQRFKPRALIDIATLTGACLIALGRHRSGLLANSDRLANGLLRAGARAGDEAWRLPIGPEYDQQLKSNFADMANIGGREAGTITAACFLARFVKDTQWAHLDIAGTAWRQGASKGATGRPIPLLMEYLLNG